MVTNKLKRATMEPELRKLGAKTGGMLLALPVMYRVIGEDLPPLMQASALVVIGGLYLVWMRPRF